MSRLVLLTLVLLAASGCVRKPGTYRLLRQVVVPPEVSSPDLASRTFVAGIARGSGPCKLESPAIAIRPQGKTVRIKVKRDGLLQQPAGWLSEWSLQAEAGGCVAPGHGHMLANRIVQSLLKVTKPFVDRTVAVEFDHTSREILSLQLFGGETISWQTQDKQPYVKEVTSLLTEYPWARAARQNR